MASGTETVAVQQVDGTYKLYGYKWFSSATDADIALTLARIIDDKGRTAEVNNLLFLKHSRGRKFHFFIFHQGNDRAVNVLT